MSLARIFSFEHQGTVSGTVIFELANSGALDEISNAAGSIELHIRRSGLLEKGGNTVRRGILFVIYETGHHGPQNGYRLCLVHQGFQLDESGLNKILDAGQPINPETKELIVLGQPREVYADA